MVERLHFLRRLGVPGSAVIVLSQLSNGDKTTSEMSQSSGMSKSAILVGINYWHKLGVAKRSKTNEWQINELDHVKEMVEILKAEEDDLISSIARINELIDWITDGNAQTVVLDGRYMALIATRGLYLYLEVLTTALDDDIVTDDEASILKVLAIALGMDPSNVGAAMDVARGIDPSPITNPDDYSTHQIGDASTYQSALVAALDDEVITEDEWAILENLRKLLGIQPDQHALIEEAIRAMSEHDEHGERRLERLERFNTVCPYF